MQQARGPSTESGVLTYSTHGGRTDKEPLHACITTAAYVSLGCVTHKDTVISRGSA